MSGAFLKVFHIKHCQGPTHNPSALLTMIKEDKLDKINQL